MRKPRPPPLYRISRSFRIASVLVVILIIAYLVFAGWSLFQLKGSDISGQDSITPALGNQSASLGGDLSITNPGLAPVNSIAFHVRLALANGVPIANISLPHISLGPNQEGRLPFALNVTFAPGSPVETLLFKDNQLSLLFAVNVTYAYVFTTQVLVHASYSWGAPFYNLTVAPAGNLTLGLNGSATLPVRVSFTNHAQFIPVMGKFVATISGPGGRCGTANLTVAAPAGQNYAFNNVTDVTGSASCLQSATTVDVLYYVGPNLALSFPPLELP